MIQSLILYVFTITDRQWKIGGKKIPVTADHIKEALDEAASMLYAEDVGNTLSVGGLIIEKTATGHSVYVHVGDYK